MRFTITTGVVYGSKVFILSGPSLTVCVDMLDGMNVVSLVFKGKEMIWYDEKRKREGATYGIPLLFPTPNRVRDNRFLFQGKYSKAVMHGEARKAAFTLVNTEVTDTDCQVCGKITFGNGGIASDYPCEFTVTVKISETSVIWEYSVVNTGTETLGYGFGLHPLFVKYEGLEISTNRDYEMEADSQLLPTGKLLAVQGTEKDFHTKTKVSALSLDAVFTSCNKPMVASLYYPEGTLEMSGSNQFTHAVVFTRTDLPFVCLESQTCSTDCHNLYSGGFVSQSGLELVEKGGYDKGFVEFRWKAT
jgi:aldose 1-epimerase